MIAMLTPQALEAQSAVKPFWTMPARRQFAQFSELDNFMVVNEPESALKKWEVRPENNHAS
ncbi:hypothetical protein AB4Y45_35585 [Paraburkholderia sp. EG287A]|uniref:hypothetical protein n=1 Tax=Paraburkholderia sp. EG287A TaxID=3237012 RepID=UPI0034D35BA6